MWVVNILIYTHLHIMMSSWGGPLKIHNIQEIVEIELMFEHICMFFFVFFYPHYKLSEKRKPTIKQEKVQNILLYYIVVKCM